MVRSSQAIAVAEALFGVAVVVVPGEIVTLLLGVALPDTLTLAVRIAGVGLLVFALACLRYRLVRSLLIYSAAAMLGLLLIGTVAGMSGVLLWPAVAVHAVASFALTREARALE